MNKDTKQKYKPKKILVTGSAGFIGSALSLELLKRGDIVVGIDNHNSYYDPKLKEARLARQSDHTNYFHVRINLEDKKNLSSVFEEHKFEYVVNLAAQAGVRYSLENPLAYINSNIVGFSNILECSRLNHVKHLVYASSSSIYGLNSKQPFSTHESTNHPVSLYAATKKSNELMAHTYSHLYNLPTTGLRLFTVYGPYDRPDMALQKFTRAIIKDEPISVYNNGKHHRDFTYINDTVDGIVKVVDRPALSNIHWDSSNPDPATSIAPYRIYNIGNNKPIKLMDYIRALETSLGKSAQKKLLPIQPGDVKDTYADVEDIETQFNFKPKVSVIEGVDNFVRWYKSYYNV